MALRSGPSGLTVAAKIGIGLGFAALGLVTAPAAALVSRMVWRTGVTIPYGLVLSAAASLAVIVLARAVARGYAFVAAAAWLVALAVVLAGTPGGGFVVADDALGWAFLAVDCAVVLGATLLGGGRAGGRR